MLEAWGVAPNPAWAHGRRPMHWTGHMEEDALWTCLSDWIVKGNRSQASGEERTVRAEGRGLSVGHRFDSGMERGVKREEDQAWRGLGYAREDGGRKMLRPSAHLLTPGAWHLPAHSLPKAPLGCQGQFDAPVVRTCSAPDTPFSSLSPKRTFVSSVL